MKKTTSAILQSYDDPIRSAYQAKYVTKTLTRFVLSVGSADIASGKCRLLPGDHSIPNNLTMPSQWHVRDTSPVSETLHVTQRDEQVSQPRGGMR